MGSTGARPCSTGVPGPRARAAKSTRRSSVTNRNGLTPARPTSAENSSTGRAGAGATRARRRTTRASRSWTPRAPSGRGGSGTRSNPGGGCAPRAHRRGAARAGARAPGAPPARRAIPGAPLAGRGRERRPAPPFPLRSSGIARGVLRARPGRPFGPDPRELEIEVDGDGRLPGVHGEWWSARRDRRRPPGPGGAPRRSRVRRGRPRTAPRSSSRAPRSPEGPSSARPAPGPGRRAAGRGRR